MTQQKSKTNSAVVIGGGFSGLATAALLGKSGRKVPLVEKNLQLDGRVLQGRTLPKFRYQ